MLIPPLVQLLQRVLADSVKTSIPILLAGSTSAYFALKPRPASLWFGMQSSRLIAGQASPALKQTLPISAYHKVVVLFCASRMIDPPELPENPMVACQWNNAVILSIHNHDRP